MNKEFNLKTGKLGEEIAKKFLGQKGYKVLQQNYRTKFVEIDLICQQGQEKIAVEVRTKRGYNFGSPEESLTKKKLRQLWLAAKTIRADRVDAVCIVLGKDNNVEKIAHHENIL
jgi:putative endonuclease